MSSTPSPAPSFQSLLPLWWAWLLSLTISLAACGGGGSPVADPPLPTSEATPATIATAKTGDVLAYVKRKLQARGPQGGTAYADGDIPDWLSVTASASGAVSRSGTLVQEAGVDEDDLIKTDGTRIVTLVPLPADSRDGNSFGRLDLYTLDGTGKPVAAASTTLTSDSPGWVSTRGLLLADRVARVAVMAEGTSDAQSLPVCVKDQPCADTLLPYRPTTPQVHVQLVDISLKNGHLPKPDRMVIDGRLVGTRQIGNMLYLVATHAPKFAFDLLPTTSTTAERSAALISMSIADVLPQVSVNGGPRVPLMAETDCWLQDGNASTQIALTTLTAIDLGSPTYARSSRCFVGGTEALYMSPANIYLATTRNDIQTLNGRLAFSPEMRTDIHKFAVSGSSFNYRGSGSINGSLGWDREKNAYRMSEFNGDLRVLGFSGSQGWVSLADAGSVAPSPATLTVLRERTSDATLQTVATLPNAQHPAAIGKDGEQIYAVRFLGDRGYVVTFRQSDPLYVLDLSNPADPRSVGELQVPGFSDWLFPIDGSLLFGVGKDATAQGQVQGVKVALFDVHDASSPKLLDSRSFGARGSSTALDSSAHGLSLMVVGDTPNTTTRLALPMLLAPADIGLPAESLQRFEINSAARSLLLKPAIALGNGWVDLSVARSLQIGDQLYHLQDGKLQSWDW